MSEDLINFEDAAAQLGVSSSELEEAVNRGDIRATRDGDAVLFRGEDLSAFRRSRETEPTIVLSDSEDTIGSILEDSPIDLDSISTDETVLNIEGLLEDETEGTTPIPGSSILEGEDEISIGGDVGDDTVLDTDDLDLDGDFDLGDDDTLLTEEDTLIGGGGARRVQMVPKQSHAWATILLAATFMILLLPLALIVNLMVSDGGNYPFDAESPLLMLAGLVDSLLG